MALATTLLIFPLRSTVKKSMLRPKRQTRKRRVSNSLDFSQLEDRQLLAANLSSGLQVPNDLPGGTNLVTNGEFETFDQGTAFSVINDFATARFLPGVQVTGWNVADGDGDGNSVINLLSFDNDRGTILDLDSIPDQDDRVFQDVTTQAGRQYLLAFDFRNSPLLEGADSSTYDFEVYWNDELIASMTGGDFWQTAAFTVTGASGQGDDVAGEDVLSRLEFRDMSAGNRGGDGRGSLIDCVRLTEVTSTSITNGSFENVGTDAGPNFAPEDVEGWSVFNFADDAEPRVIQIDEFQTDGPSTDGDNFLSLNSNSELIDQVFQDIATDPDRTYYVTFDYRVDPNSSADPDQLRVRWNNAWAATFTGTSEWQSVGILLDADSDTTRLTFREAGGETGDGAGPQIDNVQIFAIDQIVNDLAIDLNGTDSGTTVTPIFIEGSEPLPVVPNLTLSHESGTQLTSAAVALVETTDFLTQTLAVDDNVAQAAGISADFNTTFGLLSLTGTATVAEYQAVLRTLTYQNTADAFTTVSQGIGFAITDDSIEIGAINSEIVTAEVTLSGVNDAPTLAAIDDQSTGFGETLQFQASAADLDGEDLTFDVSVADLATNELQPSISDEGEFSWIPSEAGTFAVTITATDAANAVVEQTFDVTVSEFVPFEGIGALSNIPGPLKQGIFDEAPPQNIDLANTFDAIIETDVGTIEIRLLDDESPTFVNNFVNLARDGFYDGLVFHRVIDNFVAQGGDPTGTGSGGPGYQIPDEVDNTIPFDSRGQLSFANAGNNTTGSQFFVTLSPTNLNTNQFSVFGNVTAGDDVLAELVRTQVGNNTPIPGAEPSVINSITIVETPGDVG